MTYNPCQSCHGEDCQCCSYYLENRENQPNAEIDPEELDMYEDLEALKDPEATEAGQRRLDNLRSDYEKDTPFGQALGDGFDDAFYGDE